MPRELTTTQLERTTRQRIEALKIHPRQTVDEIVAKALDALERERREDGSKVAAKAS